MQITINPESMFKGSILDFHMGRIVLGLKKLNKAFGEYGTNFSPQNVQEIKTGIIAINCRLN